MRAYRISALVIAIAIAFAGAAQAKLPAPSPEAQAKAAEAKAKTDWGTKVAAFQLCKVQDQVAARYHADVKNAGKEVRPGAAAPTPCADPGPFVYAAASTPAPPLEAAGAHSPTATAVAPPSGKATSAEQTGTQKK